MRRAAFALGVALCCAPSVAGCGGDERLSRTEFVERATAVCARAEEQIGGLAAPASEDELAAYAREARAITEQSVADLRELEPPEPLERGFDRYLERAHEVVDLLEELEGAAADGNSEEARRIAGQIGTSAEAQEAARAAGIAACEDGES